MELAAAHSSVQYLNVNPTELTLTDVPIDYMDCNGAAFLVDDVVIVEFTTQAWTTPTVVGFKTNPRPCCFADEPYYTEDRYTWHKLTYESGGALTDGTAKAGGILGIDVGFTHANIALYTWGTREYYTKAMGLACDLGGLWIVADVAAGSTFFTDYEPSDLFIRFQAVLKRDLAGAPDNGTYYRASFTINHTVYYPSVPAGLYYGDVFAKLTAQGVSTEGLKLESFGWIVWGGALYPVTTNAAINLDHLRVCGTDAVLEGGTEISMDLITTIPDPSQYQ